MKMESVADTAGPVSPAGITRLQRYFLEVLGEERLKDISVVSFTLSEEMGQPYRIDIVATHPQRLAREVILGHEATFRMVPDGACDSRVFAGRITRFSHTSTTKDQSQYEITVKPHIGCLIRRTTQTYQNQTAPEIIESILRRNDLKGHQFVFKLRRRYAQHKFRFQYQTGDWNYINLLMQQEGIYSYIMPGKSGDVVVFGDDIDHYIYQPALTALSRTISGMVTDAESVSVLRTHTEMVPQSYIVADYNPDLAWERLRAEANVARKDTTTYGQPYIYGTHHLDQDGARWEAQLRHEAALASQVVYEGESNVLALQPARILRMDEDLPDAPNGQVIIEVTHCGARDEPYRNTYKAIPSDRRFRLKLEEETWPKITGTLSARVTSPGQYKYAYLTQQGHYVVRFDCDFGEWSAGGESIPLRLAKPFAGGLQTGFHFPVVHGTEAIIEFRDGDPNKPYISAFHHNSQQVDLITSQDRLMSRNRIYTQSGNEFDLEDWQGQEYVRVSTEHSGKSQLTLGHIVSGTRQKRGEGFELRTSGHGAIRGGKGLLISADDKPGASGVQLDMEAARDLLQQALQQSEALASVAKAAQAIAADYERQKTLLNDTLQQLKGAGILASAPAGMGLVSGGDLQLSAARNLIGTAGGNADFSIVRRFTVAAGEAISLFAHKLGMKLFAAQGKVEIQAQSDAMDLAADKDMTITSVNGRVVIEATQELLLKCGGSYFRMTSTGIEDGTPGNRTIKAAAFCKQGKDSMPADLPELPKPAATECALRASQSGIPFARF